jgi:hypothetical protein
MMDVFRFLFVCIAYTPAPPRSHYHKVDGDGAKMEFVNIIISDDSDVACFIFGNFGCMGQKKNRDSEMSLLIPMHDIAHLMH